MLTYEGEEALGQILFQGDNAIVAAGGNFYLGLCNQIPDKNDTLVDITTEPTVTNGYARIAIPRSAAGFPTIDVVNGETRILSLLRTFTASGGDFSSSFTRAFLCNVASGSTGILFGFSGALPTALLIEDGQSKDLRWEFYP